MEAKHTPGPWEARFERGIKVDAWRVYAQNGEWRIASGPNWLEEHGAENLANARLIEAAPTMLDALRGLLDALAMGPLDIAARYGPDAGPDEAVIHAAHKARAVIAKATGTETDA